MTSTTRSLAGFAGRTLVCLAAVTAPAVAANPAVGRWDLTLDAGPAPSWLAIAEKDGAFTARFLYQWASVYDLEQFKLDGDRVEFQAENQTWIGTIKGDAITGTRSDKDGNKGTWTGRRFVPKLDVTGTWLLDGKDKVTLTLKQAGSQITGELKEGSEPAETLKDVKLEGDRLRFAVPDEVYEATIKGDMLAGVMTEEGSKKYEFTARRERKWGKPIELFNGKNLDGWKPLGNPAEYKWKVVEGLMHCDGHSANIVSERKFRDFKLHVEFRVPDGGNSGVYLRGRYEIQVAQSAGEKPTDHGCGAIYSRVAPKVNAGKPAGEWQTYDITLVGHHVTVVWNGKTVHDNVEIEGITGGAIDSNESEPGPIYLQGDHTAIDYRKLTLTPAE